ncbi:hypothetical protein FRC08_002564 [Ceratobasidium sp. 394]|nr:hypothetical protein FRC08_002564 [Ceratobasidium sp. 394]
MSVHYRGIDNIDEKEPDEIKAKEDFWRIRETLVEGADPLSLCTNQTLTDHLPGYPEYRSIGILSVFLAGVQAQCLGLADSTEIPRDRDVQAINTLFIGGLLLSLFGALSSSNLARWIG